MVLKYVNDNFIAITVMPIVSRLGSEVDIGLAISIGQYRKSNIG